MTIRSRPPVICEMPVRTLTEMCEARGLISSSSDNTSRAGPRPVKTPSDVVKKTGAGLQPCGTRAAYERHRKHGETPCDLCIEAAQKRNAERDAGRREQCGGCGKLVYRGSTSAEVITCRDCRRAKILGHGSVLTAVRQCAECEREVQGYGLSLGLCHTCYGRKRTRKRTRERAPKICVMPGCSGEVERRGRREFCPNCLVTHRRPARGLAKGGTDGVTGYAILARDGWRCQLSACLARSRDIDPNAVYPDPWSGCIDHVVPRCIGGIDVALNKRAAHRRCNTARGAALDGTEPIAQLTERDWIPRVRPAVQPKKLKSIVTQPRDCCQTGPTRPHATGCPEAARRAARAQEAWEMRAAGRTWQSIANTIGAKDPAAAYALAAQHRPARWILRATTAPSF